MGLYFTVKMTLLMTISTAMVPQLEEVATLDTKKNGGSDTRTCQTSGDWSGSTFTRKEEGVTMH